MIEFQRTKDLAAVREIITHPKIYPGVTDDYSPPVAEYQPIESDAVWYVLVTEDGEKLGLFAFFPENQVCWKIHTCLLPATWGQKARQIARALTEWGWKNMPCQRVITDVPEFNQPALLFAKMAGLKQFGVNEKSYMKFGKLWDQIELGVSRPEAI